MKKIFLASGVLCAFLVVPIMAQAATTTSANGSSTGSGCPDASADQQIQQEIAQNAQGTIQNMVPKPSSLQSSTCFSNILNMGSSIGLSFLNPANILKQLEQQACQAAQNALQWPISQAENAINQNGQLPDGLGGVTVGTNDSGTVSVTTGTSSGPSIPSVNTGNSTLNNILN